MAVDQPPSRWLLTLSGGYPDGIWCCSACMAPLTEGVITHEGGCPDSAPAIRAAERARIIALADAYRCPCGEDDCGASEAVGAFADTLTGGE